MSFLNDLIADLKDRKLLPVVIALAAGCVVIPMLVSMGGGGSGAPITSGTTIEQADGLPEAQLAAVIDEPGIREYSKRLDAFKQRNPFRQQHSLVNEDEEDNAAPADTTATGTPSASSAGSSSSSGDTSGGTSETSSPSGGGTSTSTSTSTEQFFYNYRATVMFGRKGNLKEKNLFPVRALPGDKKPVVLFLGPSNADPERAIFSVSANDYVKGDGTCLSDTEKFCYYVELGAGDKIEIGSQVDGNVYQLKLIEQEVVEIDDPGAARAAKKVTKRTKRVATE